MENTDVLKIRRKFKENGLVVIDQYIDPETSDRFCRLLEGSGLFNRVFQEYEVREKYISGMDVSAGVEASSHYSIDRYGIDAILPEVSELYASTLELINASLGEKFFQSPYPRSQYYAKKYESDGDRQGWHYDTNCLTVVMYLTRNVDGFTDVVYSDGTMISIEPDLGRLLIMDGKRLWHKANPVLVAKKITLLFNYYKNVHDERPASIDRLIFGF